MTILRPLNDRIIVKREQATTTTSGGIFIPSGVDKPIKGMVVAVGSGKVSPNGDITPIDVQIGEIVLFGKMSGTEVEVEGEQYLVLREEEIMGILVN